MTIHRFLAQTPVVGATTTITDSEVHHLRDVLRLSAGDHIVVSDAGGGQFAAVLELVERDRAVARIIAPLDPPRTSGITLFQGLLKGPAMDLVVQKTTELGVDRVVPLRAARCVVKAGDEKMRAKSERWQRIAAEAAKQCGRAVPPRIDASVDVGQAAAEIDGFDVAIAFWEEAKEAPLADMLEETGGAARVALFVGPEGGFTEQEVLALRGAGAAVAGLGPLTLRSETAAIAALAIVAHEVDRRRSL